MLSPLILGNLETQQSSVLLVRIGVLSLRDMGSSSAAMLLILNKQTIAWLETGLPSPAASLHAQSGQGGHRAACPSPAVSLPLVNACIGILILHVYPMRIISIMPALEGRCAMKLLTRGIPRPTRLQAKLRRVAKALVPIHPMQPVGS